MGSGRSLNSLISWWVPFAWLAGIAVVIWPLGFLLVTGLGSPSQSWDPVWFVHVVRFTYLQALLSAILSGIVGGVGAWLYSEMRFPGRQLIWQCSLLGFSLPPILVVLGFSGFWGTAGVGSWLGVEPALWMGWPAILAAHVFYNFPLFLRLVGTALVSRDREPEMAALSLGATRFRTWTRVIVPQILPAFTSAFFLTFIFCAGSFLIVLLLGGNPRFTTLEVAIYQAVKVDFDLSSAARLATVQMLFALMVYSLFLRKGVVFGVDAPEGPSLWVLPRGLGRLIVLLYVGFIAVLVGGPLLALLISSLPGWSSLAWGELVGSAGRSFYLALLAGVQVLFYAVVLAYCSRHGKSRVSRLLGTVAILPLSFSTMILTLSWALSYPSLITWLRGDLWCVALAQALIALPLAYRPIRDGLDTVPDNLIQASRLLGASPLRTLLRVELPLIRPSLWLAFLLGAGFSLGEVGAVVLFLGEGMETLPLWIFRLMGRYQFTQAYCVGVILVVLMAAFYTVLGGVRERSADN